MKKQELMARIERAIENCKELESILDRYDNPQTIETRVYAKAKREAYETVLLAMQGNSSWLNIEAE